MHNEPVDVRPPSQPLSQSPLFPHIESIAGVVPRWQPWTGTEQFVDVVRAADIARVSADRRRLASTTEMAAAILEAAHRDAAAHVRRLDEAAALERDRWFVEQARLFDARATSALGAIPATVMAIVNAVMGATAEAQPDLAIRSSIEIAMRVLQAEMRRQVLCHPLDLQTVKVHAASLEATSVEPHPSIDPGELAFLTSHGEVRISGSRAMRTLAEDLRTVISEALLPRTGSSSAPS